MYNNNKQFLEKRYKTNKNDANKQRQHTKNKTRYPIKQNQDTKKIQTNTKQQKPHTKLIKNTKNGNKIKKNNKTDQTIETTCNK